MALQHANSPTSRCQVVPLADHQVSFTVGGTERLRWYCGPQYPRPFLFPLIGPDGQYLTRMGHPGAPDHDHHRGIWFGHAKVLGIDFWSDLTPTRIRQKAWLCYQDGDHESIMAVQLGWYDGHDPKELLEQELVVALRPIAGGTLVELPPDLRALEPPSPPWTGETVVELQATFRPTAATLEFGQSNFGFLAVRVAKGMSAHFGDGTLTSNTGATGEAKLFGQPARWMDYSGSVAPGVTAGITYFDHPAFQGTPHPQRNCENLKCQIPIPDSPPMPNLPPGRVSTRRKTPEFAHPVSPQDGDFAQGNPPVPLG